MFEKLKETILSKGKTGIKLAELKKKVKDKTDFKMMNFFYLKAKKKPFCFLNCGNRTNQLTRISCRWEILRDEFLENLAFNNPRVNEVCSQILRKIFSSGEIGIFQHTIGSELGFQTRDIHHHINNLIKIGLIVKENFTIKTRSKINNAIQLKCKIFENQTKKQNLYKNFLNTEDFELFNNLIKILTRLDRQINQKDLKYGILSRENFFKIERRRIHRNWQKIKLKFLKSNIDLTLIIQKNFLYSNILFLGKKSNLNLNTIKNKILEIHTQSIDRSQLISLFLISPEIQIKNTIEKNTKLGISCPFLLEKFKGYINYKTIQTILKNLVEKKCLYTILEQKGRQRIINYQKGIEILTDYEKKIKYGVTDQVASRRLVLLSWVESRILLVRDLGRKIAQKEKRGLRKVDSKVIRRVLGDLIEKGFLKIFKVNIQILNQKSKDIEVITKKNFDTVNFDFISYLGKLNRDLKKWPEKERKIIFLEKNNYDSCPLILTYLVFSMKFGEIFLFGNYIRTKVLLYLKFKNILVFLNKKILKLFSKNNVFRIAIRYFQQKKPLGLNFIKSILQKNVSIHIVLNSIIDNKKICIETLNHQKNFGDSETFEEEKAINKTKKICKKVYSFNPNNILKLDDYNLYSYHNSFLISSNNLIKVADINFRKKSLDFISNSQLTEFRYKKLFFSHLGLNNDHHNHLSWYYNFEKWDSELDVTLLEIHLIKKLEKNRKESKLKIRKNFIRRLNGILRVGNIKLALSYFNSFVHFKKSDTSSKYSYKSKKILKRALELSTLNFCFKLEKIVSMKKSEKHLEEFGFNNKLEKKFIFFQQKNYINISSLLSNILERILSNAHLSKFNSIFFVNFSLISSLTLNFDNNFLNSKRKTKDEVITFKKKYYGKKYRPKFFFLNSCQRIILCDFYSKIECSLLSITPFFLNQDSYENKYVSNQFKLPCKKNKIFYIQLPKKITKPLEVRNRTLISLYKNGLNISNPVKICSDYVILNFQKFKQSSFFYKMNFLQMKFHKLILNKYNRVGISVQRKLKNQLRERKKKLYTASFNSLVFWSSFLIYYIEKPYNEFSLELFLVYLNKFSKKNPVWLRSTYNPIKLWIFLKKVNEEHCYDVLTRFKYKNLFSITTKTHLRFLSRNKITDNCKTSINLKCFEIKNNLNYELFLKSKKKKKVNRIKFFIYKYLI